jgi:hypothetical protein
LQRERGGKEKKKRKIKEKEEKWSGAVYIDAVRVAFYHVLGGVFN